VTASTTSSSTQPSPKPTTPPSSRLVMLFDTETSGLVSNRLLRLEMQPEVIEFYGCLVDLGSPNLMPTWEYQTLIKPKKAISAEITKITGLTNDDLKDAPPFAQVADTIAKAIESAPVVVAHNIAFDMAMLEIEFERLERKLNWPEKICTLEKTIYIKGYRLSMSRLHEYLFGVPFAGAHRAKVDVAALTRCAAELHKRGLI
jgi:DNA polymerase III epsilon subunit-like protein